MIKTFLDDRNKTGVSIATATVALLTANALAYELTPTEYEYTPAKYIVTEPYRGTASPFDQPSEVKEMKKVKRILKAKIVSVKRGKPNSFTED